MRLNAATGSPMGADNTLLEDIKSALRGTGRGQDGPSVVDAITQGNSEIIAQLRTMVQQGGGQAGGHPPAGGPPMRGTPGTGGPDDPMRHMQQQIDTVLESLERAVVSFEGGAEGHRHEGYYGRETFISTLGEADRLFKTWTNDIQREADRTTTITSFIRLLETQGNNTLKGFVAAIFNAGLSITSLGETFASLRHKIGANVTDYRSEVLGSNILTPGEHFLEVLTRVQEGILTSSDSFRTVMKTVQEAIEQNMMSPLAATGRSAKELSQDFMNAREQMRNRGVEMLGLGTAGQTEKWFSLIVDTMQKYGMKADFNDVRTGDQMYSMLGEMMRIRANTGISVDRLQDLLKQAQNQNAEMVGIGRLTPQEALNLSKMVMDLRSTFKGDSEGLIKSMYQILAAARPDKGMTAVLASNPELYSKVGVMAPGVIEQFQKLLAAGMSGANHEMVQAIIGGMGPMIRSYQDQQKNNEVIMNKGFGNIQEMMGGVGIMVNRVNSRGQMDADQESRVGVSPWGSLINRVMTGYENIIKPMFQVEFALAANTVAIIANTRAVFMLAGTMGGGNFFGGGGLAGAAGGLMRGAGTLLRGASVVGGLGAMAYGGYENIQDIRHGDSGSGIGGLAGLGIGAALGGLTSFFTGPFGPIVGGIIGQQLGSYIGGMVSPGRMAGPASASMAMADQGTAYQDSSLNVMSRLLMENETSNGFLAQIRGELARQTGYLTGTPSPAGVPAVGMGLSAANVQSVQARGARPDGSTPYSGP